MKTRRLTKKYKNKRNKKSRKSGKSRKIKNKSRKRILKGGVPPRSSSRPSSRSSVMPSLRQSLINKQQVQGVKTKQEVITDTFFKHLRKSEFPEALCALYKLYTEFSHDEIKSTLLSRDFKKQYEKTFYHLKQKVNPFGVLHCDAEARANYIYFISYIFKKIEQGGSIFCDGKELPFVYSIDKSNPSILTILKRFLGYLDTLCLATVSYTITADRYNEISIGSGTPPTNEENALCEIINNLKLLQVKYPSLVHILDNMKTHNIDGTIASYSMNTTVLSRFIKQTYTDFLEQHVEEHGVHIGDD